MALKLKIDKTQVTVGDLLDLEESPTVRTLHDFLVRFVVDANDEPMKPEDASKEIRALTMDEMIETVGRATTSITETAVPPPTA